MYRGFLQLWRSFLEWEWYEDIPCKTLFIHLLLTANHKDTKFQGKVIKRGSLITSREKLSQKTGLTIQQIRTAMTKMSPEHITFVSTKKWTEISVVEFELYNGGGGVVQQGINRQTTNDQHAEQQIFNRQANRLTDRKSTEPTTELQQIESKDISGVCEQLDMLGNRQNNIPLTESSTVHLTCKQQTDFGKTTTSEEEKKIKKKEKEDSADIGEPSPRKPTSKLSIAEKKKMIDGFTERQLAFYDALMTTEFFVPGKGVVCAYEAIADEIRLARDLGREDLYPALDVSLIGKLGAWSLQNRKKAKVNVGRFILNRATAEVFSANNRGVSNGYVGRPSPTTVPASDDLMEKFRARK